jgi:hypothetical protein
MRQAPTFWIIFFLLVVGAGGFFLWRKFVAKHTAQFAVQGQGCKGPVVIEESAYRDGETAFKREHQLQLDQVGGTHWSSGELEDRAGTQFSVLARGDCSKLSCTVVLDGDSGGSKETDSGQVTCTAMVGN